MQISYNWLRELVDFGWDAPTLASKLTLIGTAVESVQPVSTNLENVVVGKILTVEPHPHSSGLKVCKVELGRDVHMTVVCGAPNVKVGMKSHLPWRGSSRMACIQSKTSTECIKGHALARLNYISRSFHHGTEPTAGLWFRSQNRPES
jgi:hypothetical protein